MSFEIGDRVQLNDDGRRGTRWNYHGVLTVTRISEPGYSYALYTIQNDNGVAVVHDDEMVHAAD